MKILLINPPAREIYGGLPPSVQIPMGLGYIAAVIEKAGYQVKVTDMEAENISFPGLRENIADIKPDIVGITSTTPSYPSAIKICAIVKEISPDIKTVLGGIHPTIAYNEAIKPESVDFVVAGEGEKTIIELLDAVNDRREFSSVRGLVHKNGGNIAVNPPRELIQNLDEIPFPARHLFKNQRYTYPDSLSRRTFPVMTSRGCPGSCTYCNTKNIFSKKFRARSPGNVADEIEFLLKEYNAGEIHIWDDNFTTDRKRVFEIRDEIKKRGLKIRFAFPNGLRADFLNEVVLKCLKEMGAYSIAIGVESGSQEILNRVKKGIKLENIQAIFAIAKRLRIETWAFFIIGLPGETEKTIAETIDFAIRLDPDIAKFHILKPYPGTEIYDDLKKKGLLVTEDYSRYGIHTAPVHKLPDLSPEDISRWQKTAFKRFYFRPGKILQQIFRCRSLYRAELNFKAGAAFLKKLSGKE